MAGRGSLVGGLALWLGLGCGGSPVEPAPTASDTRLETEAAPFFVRDLRPGPMTALPGANPAGFVQVGATVFFTVDDRIHGQELWRTDGTQEGTALVTDLLPGVDGSQPTHLTAMGGQLYFAAQLLTASPGLYGLWRTDGTAAGTQLLLTLRQRPTFVTEHGGALYVQAPGLDSPQGFTLWKSDGTPAGTRMLKEESSAYIRTTSVPATWMGDTLYFGGFSDATGAELWTSDGTPEGTRILKDSIPGPSDMLPGPEIVRLGDRLVFWGLGLDYDSHLWLSDGTGPGTQVLNAVRPDSYTYLPMPKPIVAVGNLAYFSAWDAQAGQELWRTDGTPGGTARVADLVPGTGNSAPENLTAHEGRLYFHALDAKGQRQLWKLDAPDLLPEPVEGTPAPFPSKPEPLRSTPAGLFFQGWEDSQPRLWLTDGTQAGTRQVSSLASGRTYGLQAWAWDRLIVSASDGELLLTDGTQDGTRTVLAATAGELSAFINTHLGQTVNLDGTLVFTSPVMRRTPWGLDEYYWPLWVSDGTADGTREVVSQFGSIFARGPSNLTPVNGRVLYLLNGYTDLELWGMDGATFKTEKLSEATSPGGGPILAGTATRAYFGRFDAATKRIWELWTTDGTAKGTLRLVAAAEASSWRTRFHTPVGDLLYFTWQKVSGGDSLWVSNGTPQGTVRIKLPLEATDSFDVQGLFPSGRRVFVWTLVNGTHQLWVTEGTAESTRFVTALPDLEVMNEVATVGDSLYLVFSTSDGLPRLWKVEGQTLKPLHTFGTTRNAPRPQSLTALGNRLVFWASDGVSGYELWTSDGTPEGTVLLKDLNPGAAGAVARPGPLMALGPQGPLVFAASDGTSGLELWKTDGTAEGTVRVADVLPGPRASSPGLLGVAGRHLFFSAWAPGAGHELWALPREVTDVTPPTIACPRKIQARALTPEGAPVDLARVTVTDSQDAWPTLRMDPESGSMFPLGTTTVRATALDDTGNTATCTFEVEVKEDLDDGDPDSPEDAGGCQQGGGGANAGLLGCLLLALWAMRGRTARR
ncbi:HYR domain-containing protein [Corallococcus exiguus]|uniref:ELWxxDGT repeat protein n=1 Tax=Corallococcus exiguus TaxID=83462 RepID=UPI001494FDA5|nr:ELWxxDGT repeat protein [Corallococcus exiguus]NPC72440.1 HYR domain-containing protein [Corallococcus exiguus]